MAIEKKRVLLIIMDGYGEGKDYRYNAVTGANTPFINQLRKNYPHTLLKCHGEEVGLPKGSVGGSEVGHFTIGAGRIVNQSLQEITLSIKSGDFFKKPALLKAAETCRRNKSKFHILGMISDKGIHSHIDHLFALLKFAKEQKLQKVYIHAITDGRDVPERSAKIFIKKVQNEIKKLKLGKIATIIGRYYAMDRDTNLSRTKTAYNLYTEGKGTVETDPLKAVDNEYKHGTETDYYIKPIILDKEGLIEAKDSVVFFNYRSDRAQQITQSFTDGKIKPYFVCFGPYSKKAPILFLANKVNKNLGHIIEQHHLKQLRIAETEKYAHVTFFFNSQIKEKLKGEKRILIPSPKVASYGEKPEMSAPKITEALLKELKIKNKHDLIVLNFANCDLVGHSGNFKAVITALEYLDKCLSQIVPLALESGYDIIFTADHGNGEEMRYPNGEICPAHTLNPVIFLLISPQGKKIQLRKAKENGLKDIAPTILEIMKLKQPKEMTGKSLIKR